MRVIKLEQPRCYRKAAIPASNTKKELSKAIFSSVQILGFPYSPQTPGMTLI